MKHGFTQDFEEMAERINHTKKLKILKRELPNIISITDDGWNSNILLRTMIAMNNQNNTCKKEIMNKLYELFEEVYGESEHSIKALIKYKKYENNLSKDSPEIILKIYAMN